MHKFDPAHTARLLSGERLAELRPSELLKEAGLKKGDVAADIGCGPGFFTVPAAKIVGESGRVYALDTEEKMLAELGRQGVPENVTPIKSGENALPLEDSSIDFALMAYMFHETVDKAAFMREVKRVLRPGGRALILDWKRQKEDKGPPMEERLTEEGVAGFIAGAGLAVTGSSSLNASHYKISAVRR